MTQGRKRALLILAIWGVVAAGFAATAFSSGGPATYADDVNRRLIGAAFLACGFFGTPLMLFLTRGKADAEHVVHDERDETIGRKATHIGLIVVLVFVFLTCIALWDSYRDAGCVPVGWMWILAYSSAILTYLVPATASLLLDAGVFGRAQR
jgi:hypothetical protein